MNAEHEELSSSEGTRSTSQWYSDTGAPNTTKGAAYQTTARSLLITPTASTAKSGYMQMRWYQQSSHGM